MNDTFPRNAVILKPGKEKPLLNYHHWVFSGAIASLPAFSDGELLPVYSSQAKFLGSGYFNRRSGLIGRMVCFDATDPLSAIRKNLNAALNYRLNLFQDSQTNGYRLVNGEGDRLPGLIIDQYADVIVIQISTLGMEKLKPFIVDWLKEKINPSAIYEKSDSPSRKEEGLKSVSQILFGSLPSSIEIRENGHKFIVDVILGQKTGFFCDQREMRKKIASLSQGKTVLNCFAYSGGFSVYALGGGAAKVDSVDISKASLQMACQNTVINGFNVNEDHFHAEDVFEFLRKNPLDYDIVILDPPAFAKSKNSIVAACRGYKDINRIALQKMKSGSLLLTCSCSFHVDEPLFQKVVFQASVEAGRVVRIIGRHIMAQDHPLNICHPENDYLKSLLLYVE